MPVLGEEKHDPFPVLLVRLVEKHHVIRVLLQCSRFTQVGQAWFANRLLDRPVQLRQQNDRAFQFLRQQLGVLGDARYLLLSRNPRVGGTHQAAIVYQHQAAVTHPASLRPAQRHRHATLVVELELAPPQGLASFLHRLVLQVIHPAALYLVYRYAADVRNQTLAQRTRVHLQALKVHRPIHHRVGRELQGESSLPSGRASGKYRQRTLAQATAQQLVQVIEASRVPALAVVFPSFQEVRPCLRLHGGSVLQPGGLGVQGKKRLVGVFGHLVGFLPDAHHVKYLHRNALDAPQTLGLSRRLRKTVHAVVGVTGIEHVTQVVPAQHVHSATQALKNGYLVYLLLVLVQGDHRLPHLHVQRRGEGLVRYSLVQRHREYVPFHQGGKQTTLSILVSRSVRWSDHIDTSLNSSSCVTLNTLIDFKSNSFAKRMAALLADAFTEYTRGIPALPKKW